MKKISKSVVSFICLVLALLACNVVNRPSVPIEQSDLASPTAKQISPTDTSTPDVAATVPGPEISGLRLAFVATGWAVPGAGNDIFLMNPDGSGIVSVSNSRESDIDPAWSPDGTRIAFASKRDGNYEIYVMDANGSNQTRLTDDPARDGHPTWSPDGKQIAFRSNRDGDDEIFVMNADGSNISQLTDLASQEAYPNWSPDGQTIIFSSFGGGRQAGIYRMDADGGNVQLLASGPLHSPVWSPDGKRIALDGELGVCSFEIFIMNADGSDLYAITSHPDGCGGYNKHPAWSPDGKWIVFWSSRGEGNITNLFLIQADGSSETQLTDYESTPKLFHSPHDPAWSPIP